MLVGGVGVGAGIHSQPGVHKKSRKFAPASVTFSVLNEPSGSSKPGLEHVIEIEKNPNIQYLKALKELH